MRISDWSSDVCSSDLKGVRVRPPAREIRDQIAKRTPRLRRQFVAVDDACGRGQQPRAGGAGKRMDLLHRLVAKPTLRRVDDRSAERRVGNEGGSTVRTRWTP